MRIRVEVGRTGGARLSVALIAYAVALAVLLLVPPYLKASVGPPRGFTQQEAIDLLTPLVVIPLAWWVLELASEGLDRRTMLAFLVVAALWVEGQGIHLAANAVGDAFPSRPAADAFYTSTPGEVDLWLDETLSHWMWHLAWVLLSGLMLWVATVGFDSASYGDLGGGRGPLALVGGAVHGATFFVVSVEGVTTALGIPATIMLLVWSALLALAGRRGVARPVVTFLLVSAVVTLLGYAGWGALHGWTLPEFSRVGLFS